MPLAECDSIRVRGAAIRARFVGSQNGTPTVALHGYPDTLRVFEPLADAVAATHRTLLFDWPGQGKSDPLERTHDPWDRADFLRDLLDAAGIDRATLIAHDMGALPALAFAQRFPERVDRVVLSHALLDDAAPVSLDIELMRGCHLYPWVLSLTPGLVFDRCVASFLDPPHALSRESLAEMRADFVAARDPVIASCRAYDAALPTFLSSLRLPNAPFSLLWSSDDAALHFPVAHASALARRLHDPDGRAGIHLLPPCRHWAFAQGGAILAKIVEILRLGP